MKISIKYLASSMMGLAVWSLFTASPAYAGELSNQFTAELWVKPTNIVNRALMVKNNEIRLVTNASGNPLCQIYAAGSWQTAATSSITLTAGTWQHVACSYDRATLRVYVNGTQTGSQTLSLALDDSAANFRIGSDEGATYSDFAGVVDEHKVYNYARTPEQIRQDMTGAANPGVSSGSILPQPIAHWSFDEQNGQTAHDKAGSSHLTLGANTDSSTDDPTWKPQTSCKLNGCLYFDGGDFTNGSLSNSITNSSFSVTGWLYQTANPDTAQIWYSVGSTLSTDTNIHLRITGTTMLFGFYYDDLSVSNAFTTSTWQHVTYTYDNITKQRKVYVNGIEKGNGTAANNFSGNTTFRIGSWTNGSQNWYGYIDEVRLYNSALSAEQVRQDMNAGSTLTFGGVAGNNEAADLSDSAGNPPIAEWRLDEMQGNIVSDTSGNNYSGTITGATWNAWCKYGGCLSFDGNGDRVYLGSSQIVGGTNLAENFTIEASIKAGSDSNGRVVFSQNNSSQGNTLFELITNNTQLAFNARNDAGTLYQVTASATPLDNQWHHVSVTRNGASLLFYLDGQQLTSSTSFSPSGTFTFDEVYLGTRSGNDLVFTGLIDHVKIYDYARTPAQIAYDYNRGEPIAHWKMDECQGSTIHDSSDNGNHGTLTITTTGGNTNGIGTCTTPTSAWGSGADGKFGSSLNFDGDGDHADTETNSTTFSLSAYTVSLWIKPSSLSGLQKILYRRATNGNVNFTIYLQGNQPWFGQTNATSGINSNTTIDTSSWHHIVGVWDGTTRSIYVNGRLTNSENSVATQIGTMSTRIGSDAMDGSSPFHGQIDDVRIYNYALSETQIKKIMNEGSSLRFGE